MSNCFKKIPLFFLAIFIVIAGFCGGTKDYQVQASLLDAIKAWVTINPLEVNVSTPSEAEIKKIFKVTAEVTNKGEEEIENVEGKIFLPEGVEGIEKLEEPDFLKKNLVQKIGTIQGKKSKTISWTVRGTDLGNYIFAVSVTGELKGDLVTAEDSSGVTIEDPQEKSKPQKWYQNIFDFFRGWFK